MGFKEKSRNYGHKKGIETVESIINGAIEKNKIFNLIRIFNRKLEKTFKRN